MWEGGGVCVSECDSTAMCMCESVSACKCVCTLTFTCVWCHTSRGVRGQFHELADGRHRGSVTDGDSLVLRAMGGPVLEHFLSLWPSLVAGWLGLRARERSSLRSPAPESKTAPPARRAVKRDGGPKVRGEGETSESVCPLRQQFRQAHQREPGPGPDLPYPLGVRAHGCQPLRGCCGIRAR